MIKKAPEHPRHLLRLSKSSLLQIVSLVIVAIILVPQIDQFSTSWQYLKSASPAWIGISLVGMCLTVLCAALVYLSLVPKNLPFRRTFAIQLATYFTNRLLPSGLGGIGFNALYLVKQAKLSRTDAAVYATANNIIGFIAFTLCIIAASIVGDSEISLSPPRPIYIIVGGIIVLSLVIVSLFAKPLQRKLMDFLGHLVGVVITIIKHPARLVVSVLFSIGITASYALVLWASTKSVGIELSIVDIFIAFVAGNTALTVSPTPGGIGAVEAAVTAVLVSAGVAPSLALSAVIIYRLISYWLPVLPGYLSFRHATKNHYV